MRLALSTDVAPKWAFLCFLLEEDALVSLATEEESSLNERKQRGIIHEKKRRKQRVQE